MSNLERTPSLTYCGGLTDVAPQPVHQVFQGREVALGESTVVRRLLPNLGRRLVGAWCFVDHYGPDDVVSQPGMQVPPHPHIGLQTVSWLLDGEIHHRDSIGSDTVILRGELGLMTSGAGITHAEQSPGVHAESLRSPDDFVGKGSPVPHPAMLHGVQLWVALPDGARTTAPAWDHHTTLPVVRDRGSTATVIMGSLAGATSPGHAYSPLVGVDVALDPASDVLLPLEPEFEHAVLVMSGSVDVDGAALTPGAMIYLGCARRELRISSANGARAMLLGGVPFEEQIVMWWNFVARTNDEIVDARSRWMAGSAFGDVDGYDGYRLPAPELPPGELKPGGAVRRR